MTKYIVGILIIFVVAGCGEREGTVKWTDCREVINVKENSVDGQFKKYTCEYIRTNQGRIAGGTCIHIEYESNGQCRKAFIYEKRQDDVCHDKAYPRLGLDDLCYPK
jgi:hypothetical protein